MRGGDQPTSAGVLPAGANAGTMLVTGVREADAIAISEEKAGGTDHPTGQVGTVALA
jgi:anti-sigma-K factor RskA